MASRNGEKYILSQLRSILPQLVSGDEIVIVDDASIDETPAFVTDLMQNLSPTPRKRLASFLLRHSQQSKALSKPLKKAIRSASGDILFLSDQDDLWAPDKVPKFSMTFAANPEAASRRHRLLRH